MISVIVPIWNVKSFLSQCIDSIVYQTYTDLEILLINDGSTDGSGSIAESYLDSRIKVFHTENRGLSAARNLGIEKSTGDFILFIDADDWIELDLIEKAVANIGSADILCFGIIKEDNNQPANHFYSECSSYSGKEALFSFLNGRISNVVWNKLYRSECFSSFRFPEGRICEDTATTYKLLYSASKVKTLDYCGYHYRIRKGSLSRVHDKRNIIDYWTAIRDRFFDCKDIVDGMAKINLYKSCAWAIMRACAWRNTIPEIYTENGFYKELSDFAKSNFPRAIRKHFSPKIRIGIFFAKHPSKLSFWMVNKILIITRNFQGKSLE